MGSLVRYRPFFGRARPSFLRPTGHCCGDRQLGSFRYPQGAAGCVVGRWPRSNQAAVRSPSTRRSQRATRFQLSPVRSTNSFSFVRIGECPRRISRRGSGLRPPAACRSGQIHRTFLPRSGSMLATTIAPPAVDRVHTFRIYLRATTRASSRSKRNREMLRSNSAAWPWRQLADASAFRYLLNVG